MKRIFKIIAVILIWALVMQPEKTLAQAPDTSTMQKLLQYIFKPVNKTQILTGMLKEGAP